MKNTYLKKISLCGIFSCFALISFVLESLFPPLFIPGARMGISNIFILLALIYLGRAYAYSVLVVKVLLGSIFSGNISAMMYSFPAGIVALTVEIILFIFIKHLSIISISVFGAIINSLIQNFMFCLITNNFGYLVYLPYLSIISTISGLIIGIVVYLVVKYLPEKLLN